MKSFNEAIAQALTRFMTTTRNVPAIQPPRRNSTLRFGMRSASLVPRFEGHNWQASQDVRERKRSNALDRRARIC
jgi:hypothetical protein